MKRFLVCSCQTFQPRLSAARERVCSRSDWLWWTSIRLVMLIYSPRICGSWLRLIKSQRRPAPVWNPMNRPDNVYVYDYSIPPRTLKLNSCSTELMGGSSILCPASITSCFERCVAVSIVIGCVSTLMAATYCDANIPCGNTCLHLTRLFENTLKSLLTRFIIHFLTLGAIPLLHKRSWPLTLFPSWDNNGKKSKTSITNAAWA